MVRLLICDDQIIVVEGLQKILNANPQIEVVGTAYNGAEALDLIPKCQPDLVLMDLKMPVMNGIIATRKIKEQYPLVHVLVLTTYDDDEWLFDAIRSGAEGYLLKDTTPNELVEAIVGTVEGKSYVDPHVTSKLLEQISQDRQVRELPTNFNFSEREYEVLKLLAQGMTNADIASQLYLSEGTVRNYTSEIFAKLGVSDRTQAAVTAIRYGLVNLDDLDS